MKICDSLHCDRETESEGTKFCSTCRSAQGNVKRPIKYAYSKLKSHANERGIPFSLTFEHFKEFCTTTEYISKRGRGKHDLSIDRIDPNLGYADGNIQALTNSQNKKKDYHDRKVKNYPVSEFYANTLY